jgi:hypothetical protein
MSGYFTDDSNETRINTPPAIRSPTSAPPISPRSTATILQLNQQNPEAVMDVAQGLIASIHKAQIERGAEKEARDARIRELEAQLQHERLQRPQPGEAPDGFVINNDDRTPYFVIPIQDGYYQSAYWVQLLPRGKVAGLPKEHTPGATPFVSEIYADRDENSDHDAGPVYPLPTWAIELLTGPAASYGVLLKDLEQNHPWGLVAEVMRYREYEHQRNDLRARISLFETELRGLSQAQMASGSRLELTRLDQRVSDLQVITSEPGRKTKTNRGWRG